MTAKQFAAELRRVVAEAKETGTEAIKCENLIAYLDQFIQSPGGEPSAVDVEKYKADLQVAINQGAQQHEHNIEMFKSVMMAGQSAIKSSLLLNGGASIALLAFIAHLADQQSQKIPEFAACLLWFTFGALAIVVTSGFTYLSQWLYADRRTWPVRFGFGLNIACILLGISSYVLFVIGLFSAYGVFNSYS